MQFRFSTLTYLLVALAASYTLAPADSWADEFDQCLVDLRAQALAQNHSTAAVEAVFAEIKPLPEVIRSDRAQAEFTDTFREYYDRRVTQTRVDRGRELLQEHAALLSRIAAEYGVPPHYLLSFWGLETNFGSYLGNISIPSALATLACDPRRAKFFTQELFAAIRIVESGDMRAEDMIGSWAGAVGHTQFMPTTYLAHARDGDGDSQRDLLGSIPDALTSAASYLKAIGWQTGFRWGREVYLPNDFDYAKTGAHQWRTLAEWRSLGVRTVFNQPVADIDLQAALLVPSGHKGPAFLVYPNFRTIMQWNRSSNYAIAVGRLADRIAGAGELFTPPADTADIKFRLDAIKQLQAQLNVLGYDTGRPDGIVGRGTRKALQRFQEDHGLIADGFPSREVFAQVAALSEG